MNSLRFALLAAVFGLAACASHHTYLVSASTRLPAAPQNPYIPPGDPYASLPNVVCQNVFTANEGSTDYVVARTIAPDKAPLSSAQVSGNLAGFGERKIHNDSDNTDLTVDILYHASSSAGTDSKLSELGC